MPIFKGIPPGQKINFTGIFRSKDSVMCPECKKKFKEWLKDGGSQPKPCEVCKSNLKDKMINGRYPDRTNTPDMADQQQEE